MLYQWHWYRSREPSKVRPERAASDRKEQRRRHLYAAKPRLLGVVETPPGEHLAVIGQDLTRHPLMGQHRRRRAIGQGDVADHVHLPQLLVAPAPTASICASAGRANAGRSTVPGPTPDTRPTPRAPAPHHACQFKHQSPRTPVRARVPQLQHHSLDLSGHLMRTRRRPMRPIHQAHSALGLVPRQPAMQRLPRRPLPSRLPATPTSRH